MKNFIKTFDISKNIINYYYYFETYAILFFLLIQFINNFLEKSLKVLRNSPNFQVNLIIPNFYYEVKVLFFL